MRLVQNAKPESCSRIGSGIHGWHKNEMEYDLKNLVWLLLILAIAVMASSPASAHHGILIYDSESQVILAGTVTEWKFANPHVQFSIDVTDDQGNVVNWAVEGGSVYFWSRAGWNRGSLRPGNGVEVTVYPARDGRPLGVVSKIVLSNGRELVMETEN